MAVITADLGQRIRDVRKGHGLTQGEFATHLGVSQGLVSRWERGEQTPQSQAIARLAGLAGVSVGEFHYGTDAASREDTGTAPTGKSAASPLPGMGMKRLTDFIAIGMKVARATRKRDVAAALSVILEKCRADDAKHEVRRRRQDAALMS